MKLIPPKSTSNGGENSVYIAHTNNIAAIVAASITKVDADWRVAAYLEAVGVTAEPKGNTKFQGCCQRPMTAAERVAAGLNPVAVDAVFWEQHVSQPRNMQAGYDL